MMSMFCPNTLIFAPEYWKFIVRGPGFNFFFQKLAPLQRVFSFSTYKYSKASATYLLKTLRHVHSDIHSLLLFSSHP